MYKTFKRLKKGGTAIEGNRRRRKRGGEGFYLKDAAEEVYLLVAFVESKNGGQSGRAQGSPQRERRKRARRKLEAFGGAKERERGKISTHTKRDRVTRDM